MKVKEVSKKILIIGCLMIVIGVLMIIAGIALSVLNYDNISKILLEISKYTFIISFILGCLFVIFLCFVDVFEERVHLTPLKISSLGIKNFKNILIEALKKDKYKSEGREFTFFDCDIQCLKKETMTGIYVYLIFSFRNNKVTKENIDEYVNYCVGKLKLHNTLTQSIFVTRIFLIKDDNESFDELCNVPVFQNKYDFKFSVFVNLKREKIYFAPQGNQEWENIYKKQFKKFKLHIQDLLEIDI